MIFFLNIYWLTILSFFRLLKLLACSFSHPPFLCYLFSPSLTCFLRADPFRRGTFCLLNIMKALSTLWALPYSTKKLHHLLPLSANHAAMAARDKKRCNLHETGERKHKLPKRRTPRRQRTCFLAEVRLTLIKWGPPTLLPAYGINEDAGITGRFVMHKTSAASRCYHFTDHFTDFAVKRLWLFTLPACRAQAKENCCSIYTSSLHILFV